MYFNRYERERQMEIDVSTNPKHQVAHTKIVIMTEVKIAT